MIDPGSAAADFLDKARESLEDAEILLARGRPALSTGLTTRPSTPAAPFSIQSASGLGHSKALSICSTESSFVPEGWIATP